MPDSPLSRLPIVPESVRSDRRVTGHDRYRVMRRVACMTQLSTGCEWHAG